MLTLDPRRHQPTAREVGHDSADRGALVPCKLSSRGDDVVIDVKRRAHDVMLAHHRIMFDNECRRLSFCSADHARATRASAFGDPSRPAARAPRPRLTALMSAPCSARCRARHRRRALPAGVRAGPRRPGRSRSRRSRRVGKAVLGGVLAAGVPAALGDRLIRSSPYDSSSSISQRGPGAFASRASAVSKTTSSTSARAT